MLAELQDLICFFQSAENPEFQEKKSFNVINWGESQCIKNLLHKSTHNQSQCKCIHCSDFTSLGASTMGCSAAFTAGTPVSMMGTTRSPDGGGSDCNKIPSRNYRLLHNHAGRLGHIDWSSSVSDLHFHKERGLILSRYMLPLTDIFHTFPPSCCQNAFKYIMTTPFLISCSQSFYHSILHKLCSWRASLNKLKN